MAWTRPPQPVTTLTPELATQWLDGQRNPAKIIPSKVDRYAAVMADGRWKNVTIIWFSPHGTMTNGQHRCLAVIQSGVDIPVLVRTINR